MSYRMTYHTIHHVMFTMAVDRWLGVQYSHVHDPLPMSWMTHLVFLKIEKFTRYEKKRKVLFAKE